MNLYIDESGSFANSPHLESWNVVAAIACAESASKAISDAVRRARLAAGASANEEVKLNRLDDRAYFAFLDALDRQDILLFATATDAGLNSSERVARHQAMQVTNIRDAIPRMRYEGGRLSAQLLASQLEALSPQLYVQLICQVNLLHDVLRRSINYFAQRRPGTLREFRWRIDQKNVAKPTFEETFVKIAPALLQTRSIREPMEWVHGFNYSHMKAYEFEDGKAQDYLQTGYRLPSINAIDIQKIIRGNIEFVDSKSIDGVQAVDLLASGLRRLLRGQFSDSTGIAHAIGRLTMENRRGLNPISLTSFSEVERLTAPQVTKVIRTMSMKSKGMMIRGSVKQVSTRRFP